MLGLARSAAHRPQRRHPSMFPLGTSIPRRSQPLMTWLIVGLNVLIFFAYSDWPAPRIEALFGHYGIVPARYTHPQWAQHNGLAAGDLSPFLWSMFLHGGLLHLVGNMWTLWIFGPNVEERIGSLRFGLFYLLGGLMAGLVHVWANGDSTIPTVGASGAIACIMGAFLSLYPHARVLFMIPIFFYPFFFVWPAGLYLVYWFGLQFFSGTLALASPQAAGGVAWWAHIGGFLFGALVCRLFCIRQRRTWDPPADYPVYLYREH